MKKTNRLKKGRILTVKEFRARFGDHDQCARYLASERWPNGFRCPRCGGRSRGYMASRQVEECAACGYQCSVTAGTIFHKTRVPLAGWFWAIYRMGQDKKGISAVQLSQEIGVSYPTAWLLQHKIRKAMADRDQRYPWSGLIEVDEGYAGGAEQGVPRRDEEPKPSRRRRWRSPWNVALPERKGRNPSLGLRLWPLSRTRRPAAGTDFCKPKSNPAVGC